MSDKLLKRVEPRKITLADGKEYKLGPVNLNVLTSLEDEFKCNIGGLDKEFGKREASTLRLLLYVLLKENHPEMTKERAGKLVSMEIMPQVSDAINTVVLASKAI